MCQKAKEDAFVAWVKLAISETISIFSSEGNLERSFIEVVSSSDLSLLIPQEDQENLQQT